MKNKKLFAILTLVCFMMTLMPVAAFAGDPVNASDSTSYVYTKDNSLETKDIAKVEMQLLGAKEEQNATTNSLYVWVTKSNSSVPVESVEVSRTMSTVNGVDTLGALILVSDGVYNLTGSFDDQSVFYVQFYAQGTYVVHMSVNQPKFENGKISAASEFDRDTTVEVTAPATSSKDYAALVTFPTDSFAVNYNEMGEATSSLVGTGKYETVDQKVLTQTGTDTASNPIFTEQTVTVQQEIMEVVKNASNINLVEDGYTLDKLNVRATNVEEKTVTIKLYNNATDKKYLAGKTLKIEPVGAIDVDTETVTTDRRGEASFKVSGKYNGSYKIYVSCGQFGFTINVQVGSTAANTIKWNNEVTRPVDLLGETDFDLDFDMYDVNGNKLSPVKADAYTQGWYKAANSNQDDLEFPQKSSQEVDATGYVAVISQPSASKITNEDLTFDGTTIISKKPITAEGTYEFRVVLDNGNYATAKVEVKEFQTPVSLHVEYPDSIELGATITPGNGKIYWLDANGTKKNAKTDAGVKVDLAATGYAVANFDAKTGTLTAKTDEKYVGDTITITAVDQRYNLIATDEVKDANDAKELKFEKKSLDVNINNEIKVEVVDQDGTVVALGSDNNRQNATYEISYVILDKPEDARVYAVTKSGSESNLTANGYFTMNLTSNKVGNVAVQAVLKYSYMTTDAATNKQVNVVKYYTGTQIFAVGNGSTGDVVVMSIGSNEIVINDTVKTIDAEPMIQNDRTYVPFRALAEAFGATVAYDEATQAVTAELNGVTVVMTIGSATYTVNGAEKTMDVAPFINGSRTMVPVRFAAEAFGIKVIPTYNPDGTTADILFNL